MIVAIDTETKGLSGELFLCCIMKENGTCHFEECREGIWKSLMELASKESRRGKILYVYSYNMKFDFYKIVDWNIRGLRLMNEKPFIARHSFDEEESMLAGKNRKKAVIFFFDIWNMFRMPLREAGKLIGMLKLEAPNEIYEEQAEITERIKEECKPYCQKDTEIALSLLSRIKKEMADNGYKCRNIVSIGQLSVNVFLQWCKKNGYKDIFDEKQKNTIIKPFNAKKIHLAYRYGRISEKWELKGATLKGCYEADINNLYPYSAMEMEFPDLKSERMIKDPCDFMSLKSIERLIEEYPIGICKCIVKTPDTYDENRHGFLVTRCGNARMFPNAKDRILSGSYTHLELQQAFKEGYKLLHAEYLITFKQGRNPFKEYFKEIYRLRKSGDLFSDYFWKMMANFLIGKFAQIRPHKEYAVDGIEEAEKYIQMGYNPIKSFGTNYVYLKEGIEAPSKHYNPIISAQVNAFAKIYHWNFLKKIPYEDFVYCDTDNIIFRNKENLKHLPISKEIGHFKMKAEDVEYLGYGKKQYLIDREVRAAGATKSGNEMERKERIELFKEGTIKYRRMQGIGKGIPLEEAGTFKEVEAEIEAHRELKSIKEAERMDRTAYLDEKEEHNMAIIERELMKLKGKMIEEKEITI